MLIRVLMLHFIKQMFIAFFLSVSCVTLMVFGIFMTLCSVYIAIYFSLWENDLLV